MSNMLNIVLFGPPGAGKGTQSQKLIDKYGLVHLSTGDILRSEIARGTALGMEAKQIMDRGDLVSDDIVIGMIESKLDAEPNAKGFIFDGFPRTQAQAVALDDLLQKKGTAISAMLALEVDNEELVKRLLLRGQESGRPDDQNEEIIRNRVNEYNNKTLPLKKYYSEQAKFHSIHGIGSIDSIFKDLCDRITFVNAEIELTELENDIEHLDLTINDFEVATEISPELQKDIEEVRQESKSDTKREEKPKGIIATIKEKVSNFFHSDKKEEKPAAKKARAKPAKVPVKKKALTNTASAPAKKSAKKAVKKTASGPSRASATKAKPVKKAAPKKAVKKAAKKVTPKKAVSKKTAKKAAAPKKAAKKVTPKKVASGRDKSRSAIKKVVKKASPKKAIKKVAPKKAATKKAINKAAKKVVKAVKKATPKKVVKKVAPKKAAKRK